MSIENQLVMPDHVSDVKITRTALEDMVNKVLADKLKANRETKLTWADRGKRVPSDKVQGEFNGRLEYIRIGRGAYWIQNGKIFDGAKRRIKIDEVVEFYRPYVETAFANFKKQAIAADDSLCPRCLDNGEPFVAESHEDYANHVITKHPGDAFTKLQGEPVVTQVQPLRVYTSQTLETPKSNFICEVCSKNLPTERGWKIHTARVHKA